MLKERSSDKLLRIARTVSQIKKSVISISENSYIKRYVNIFKFLNKSKVKNNKNNGDIVCHNLINKNRIGNIKKSKITGKKKKQKRKNLDDNQSILTNNCTRLNFN